ncbi:uncharacterized protein LOC127813229 [Diospyros lotus]|uniref:uncharacterized protein LOC127813229 n=1 Tax=Diospyros lotus TaxID=55363 RepID=UPI0022500A78|nr:uncharacterized protein LOC127813229 [Diospyros lotus]
MAASSPAANNTTASAAVPSVAATVPATNASKNLRGLNKPKCIKCGNVARSRCPYQSCKSCCAKAQNPCHIHVLKSNAAFSDKTPSSASPLFDQQSTEASPAGNSHRLTSLRQLSNNFAQFNNLQSPLRSRKPLTRKDAAIINEWRFLKLKEYKEGNREAGNQAFDRYVENISLLEKLFGMNSTGEGSISSHFSESNSTSVEDSNKMVEAGLKLKLAWKPTRTENLRKRLRVIIDQGLAKLRKIELDNGCNNLNKQDALIKNQEKVRSWPADRASALDDLLDKLNKARNEEDLKSCLEMKHQLFNQHRTAQTMTEGSEMSEQETSENDSSLGLLQSDYSIPKWFSTATVDQDALNQIDIRFSSLGEDILSL